MGIALVTDHAFSHFVTVDIGHTAYGQSCLDGFYRAVLLGQTDQIRHTDLGIFLTQTYCHSDHTALWCFVALGGGLGNHPAGLYRIGIVLLTRNPLLTSCVLASSKVRFTTLGTSTP